MSAPRIQIKARIPSVEAVLPRAQALAAHDEHPQLIHQDDTFFRVPLGRLKLRVYSDGAGELIHYERASGQGHPVTRYVRSPAADPDSLREVLERAWGLQGRVVKHRILVLIGAASIHLDKVEGLGDFLELEVGLQEEQTQAEGERIARELLQALGVPDEAVIAGAYLDLLQEEAAHGP